MARAATWGGLVVLLAGCAAGDQPQQELRLSADTYRLPVHANSYPLPQRVENMALLRAAELTLQAGYDRFVVVGRPSTENPSGDVVIRMVAETDPAYVMALDAKHLEQELRLRLAQ